MIILPGLLMPASGTTSVSFPVPQIAALVGQRIVTQALDVNLANIATSHFTNCNVEVVVQ